MIQSSAGPCLGRDLPNGGSRMFPTIWLLSPIPLMVYPPVGGFRSFLASRSYETKR